MPLAARHCLWAASERARSSFARQAIALAALPVQAQRSGSAALWPRLAKPRGKRYMAYEAIYLHRERTYCGHC